MTATETYAALPSTRTRDGEPHGHVDAGADRYAAADADLHAAADVHAGADHVQRRAHRPRGRPGQPPAQKLASAFVIFLHIVTSATHGHARRADEHVRSEIDLQCFYVRQSDCIEVGFFVSLTANQPLSWLANDGANNPLPRSAPCRRSPAIGEPQVRRACAARRARLPQRPAGPRAGLRQHQRRDDRLRRHRLPEAVAGRVLPA